MNLAAKFGGVEFDVTNVRDRVRRDLEVNQYVNRPGADIRDRGSAPRETTCEVIWWPREPIAGEQIESGLDHLSRFRLFYAEVMRGRVDDFRHPLEGGYRAAVDEINWSTDFRYDDDIITGVVTFVEDSTNPSPLINSSAKPAAAGLSDAQVSLDDARLKITEIDASADVDFLDTVEGLLGRWREPDQVSDIRAELGQAIRLIETARNNLGLTDVADVQAFIAIEELASSMREAAEAVRQDQPQFFHVEVEIDQPLRRWIVDFYNGRDVALRFEQIMALNLIDDPGYVEGGTQLLVPVDAVGEQRSLRSAT